ncbi:MAG: serine/threonine protein kinase [Nannocystaceae bacterium]|nr:serine/threonine protein kinase [Nannocystaceae bacterium]
MSAPTTTTTPTPGPGPTPAPPGVSAADVAATAVLPGAPLDDTGPLPSRRVRVTPPRDGFGETLPYPQPGEASGGHAPAPAASSGSEAGLGLIVDRDVALERQEHAAAVARMRRLLPLACGLWLGFVVVDWVLATFVAPAPLSSYVVLRLIGLLPLLGCTWWLRREPMVGPVGLRILDGIMTASCAAVLTDMCLLSGGLESPYASYIALVLVGRAAALPNHWRVGAVQLGVPVLVHPLVFLAAAPFSDEIATQLRDPHAVSVAFFHSMLLVGAWGLLVIGGHNVWALRRQVFRARSIGRYRLERRIGRGGMGEVWVAYHEQLRRDVALKILRPEYGTDAIAVERFEREVMTTAALTHPNTVRIFDHGTTEDGLWYYAMELLDGEDLSAIVRRQGPMPPARAIHLALQAARALAEAHARGIVHRDIKPENLFVARLGGESDVIKLLDFGIARSAALRDSRLTSTGWVAGTPAYVSPEAAKGEPAGAPADVYGVGMALFWALTGTVPFGGDSPMEVLARQVNDPPPVPSERLGAPLPAAVDALVLRCLAKDPGERFADGGALASALEALARTLPWQPPPPTRSKAAPARP